MNVVWKQLIDFAHQETRSHRDYWPPPPPSQVSEMQKVLSLKVNEDDAWVVESTFRHLKDLVQMFQGVEMFQRSIKG